MPERKTFAALNNAVWCDWMCRAHGQPTEFTDDLWICRGQPPRFHSNLTTLRPGATAAVRQERPGGFKDGFFDVDATAWGHSVLFEASWIWLQPNDSSPRLDWRRTSTDSELQAWEAGWASGDAEAKHSPRQFPPSLLTEPNAFCAAYRDGEMIGGCILNLTEPVVGVSNVFGESGLWADIPALSNSIFLGYPLVGYERGEDLEFALRAGFAEIGRLRVWV
jgi:hypothetical protein